MVTGVCEIAAENFGGRAQAVACIQVVLVSRILQPLMIAERRNQGVGGFGLRAGYCVSKRWKLAPTLSVSGLASANTTCGSKLWRVL